MSDLEVVLQPRTRQIGEIVTACARGELRFSGPDSAWSKISALGYRCTSLYELVCAEQARQGISEEQRRARLRELGLQ